MSIWQNPALQIINVLEVEIELTKFVLDGLHLRGAADDGGLSLSEVEKLRQVLQRCSMHAFQRDLLKLLNKPSHVKRIKGLPEVRHQGEVGHVLGCLLSFGPFVNLRASGGVQQNWVPKLGVFNWFVAWKMWQLFCEVNTKCSKFKLLNGNFSCVKKFCRQSHLHFICS